MTDILLTLILVFVFLSWLETQPIFRHFRANLPYEIGKLRARMGGRGK